MTTTVSTAVLKAVPLFSSFPEDALRTLTSMVARKSVSRSTTVMTGGDPTDSLYIVLSGRLKVMMSDAEGKEVILTILGPGEFFGEMGLIDVYGRVARLLLDMSENVDGEKIVTKRLPKQDIAKMIGASREMVSRVMKDLQMGGYIEMRGSNIVLRDSIVLPE